MVNRIDQGARRRRLAEAVWRIVTRDGLAAASVRSVAKESGLSAGSVRHVFGTQHELIVFAMEELITTVGDRVRAHAAIEDPWERVLSMLAELMPLTDGTRDEAFAHVQFVLQARIDLRLAPIADASFDAIHGLCVQAVRWLVEVDELPGDTDVEAVGTTLRALVDGLTLELLLAPHLVDPDAALEVLREQLRRVAGAEERPRPTSTRSERLPAVAGVDAGTDR